MMDMDRAPALARSADRLGRRLVELAPPDAPERGHGARWVGRFLDVGELGGRRERAHSGRRDRDRLHLSRRSQADRMWDALELVGDFRVVSYRDVQRECFDGHAFTAGRAVRHLLSERLVEVHTVRPRRARRGSPGRGFKVLALTERGASRVRERRRARECGRRVWQGLVRRRELEHDAGVTELVLETTDRVRSLGGDRRLRPSGGGAQGGGRAVGVGRGEARPGAGGGPPPRGARARRAGRRGGCLLLPRRSRGGARRGRRGVDPRPRARDRQLFPPAGRAQDADGDGPRVPRRAPRPARALDPVGRVRRRACAGRGARVRSSRSGCST